MSSDYSALEPFEASSAAIRTLRAAYIIIITILFLNMLIAMLNLKIKRADKNAGNFYHLQMASLQVEIELGLLSASERTRRDWFPTWFSYTMTETEKREWSDYIEKNPLQWARDNNFGEEKENVPIPGRESDLNEIEGAQPLTETVSADNSSPQSNSESTQRDPDAKAQAASQQSDTKKNSSSMMQKPVKGDSSAADVDTQNPPESTQLNANQPSRIEEEDYIIHTCKVCGKAGRLCTRCRLVAYCSTEHQKLDWKSHKPACKSKVGN
jgi:MYND finger protein